MEDYKYVAIKKYNLCNFPQSCNSVVPYKQHEQSHSRNSAAIDVEQGTSITLRRYESSAGCSA